MLVDSHCHIPVICSDKPEETPAAIVARAGEAGVSHMLCVNVDLETHPDVLAVVDAFPNVFGSVGIHPNTEAGVQEPTVEELCRLADHEDIVAIGETGLDYYRDDVPIELQHERFRRHIRASRETGKPLIIHCRDAGDDLVRLLKEENAHEVGGVMHCFVDTYDIAKQTMALNFRISFSGIVTFRSAENVRAVAEKLPLDVMLVETDSPWLAPVPHRGKTNEPSFVRHVAQFMAELKGTDFDTVARTTTDNFFDLFSQARRTAA